MDSRHVHPKWWQIYLIFPLMVALFALDARLKLSAGGHQAVQIGILLIVYGLVHLWLRANEAALSQVDRSKYTGTVTVIRMEPYELPELDGENRTRPSFQLPGPEIKGVLDDTFEMDYGAETDLVIPLDKISKE